jgi:hypothetical protein
MLRNARIRRRDDVEHLAARRVRKEVETLPKDHAIHPGTAGRGRTIQRAIDAPLIEPQRVDAGPGSGREPLELDERRPLRVEDESFGHQHQRLGRFHPAHALEICAQRVQHALTVVDCGDGNRAGLGRHFIRADFRRVAAASTGAGSRITAALAHDDRPVDPKSAGVRP